MRQRRVLECIRGDMRDHHSREQYLWEPVYELATAERNPEHRQQLLMEAQKTVLERARELEQQRGSDFECAALEEAAASLGEMRLKRSIEGAAREDIKG